MALAFPVGGSFFHNYHPGKRRTGYRATMTGQMRLMPRNQKGPAIRGASTFLIVANRLGGARRGLDLCVGYGSPDISGEHWRRLRLVSPGDDDSEWLLGDCFLTILLHSALAWLGGTPWLAAYGS